MKNLILLLPKCQKYFFFFSISNFNDQWKKWNHCGDLKYYKNWTNWLNTLRIREINLHWFYYQILHRMVVYMPETDSLYPSNRQS
jgi:hypothetical protein